MHFSPPNSPFSLKCAIVPDKVIVISTDLKKTGSSFCCLRNEANFSGGHLNILVKSQCEITRHGPSNVWLKILKLLGGLYSTYF